LGPVSGDARSGLNGSSQQKLSGGYWWAVLAWEPARSGCPHWLCPLGRVASASPLCPSSAVLAAGLVLRMVL